MPRLFLLDQVEIALKVAYSHLGGRVTWYCGVCCVTRHVLIVSPSAGPSDWFLSRLFLRMAFSFVED